MIGYKLMRKRKDGTIGPLFINARQRVPVGVWLDAEAHHKKGFAFRPGWHVLDVPIAPHLKKSVDRVWVQVEYDDFETFYRPESQGGKWFLAKRMKVLRVSEV